MEGSNSVRLTDVLDRTREEGREREHLRILRSLLERDYLTRPDLVGALRDIAATVRDALDSHEAFVALWEPRSAQWSATTSRGIQLDDEQISGWGSRSVLERVRKTGAPTLTTEERSMEALALSSKSLSEIQVCGVLAVPMFWWDMNRPEPVRYLAGCIYAHRILGAAPFSESDVEVVIDITRILQPGLNLLRHLEEVKRALQASRTELQDLRMATAANFDLGGYKSLDPWFSEHILLPLSRISHADRVGLLMMGPPGSGKTHLARCYHYASPRKDGPFITLDCSQLPSAETLSAELFGYAPHSGFSNAPPAGRPGKALLADKGTLFLDEIGCLPATLQQQLLGLLERGSYTPLGGNQEKRVDLQVLAATNEELPTRIEEGTFREDLYWRLGEVVLTLPPLDRRPADIPQLAQDFFEQALQRYKRKDLKKLTTAAISSLTRTDWSASGNIRGLRYVINRSVLMATPGTQKIEADDLQFQHMLPEERPHFRVSSPTSHWEAHVNISQQGEETRNSGFIANKIPKNPTFDSSTSLPAVSGRYSDQELDSFDGPRYPELPSRPETGLTEDSNTEARLASTLGARWLSDSALRSLYEETNTPKAPDVQRKKDTKEDGESEQFLKEKIREHCGVLTDLAADIAVARHLGYAEKVPYSSLRLRLKRLELEGFAKEQRERQQSPQGDLTTIVHAIQQHGSGTAAASALGMTRDALVWRLREAGLSIREILKRET